uniref:CSD domain-containing protein n=1 Tax=Caenorhabditis japonica TaxID=281687 RepID=A0A8R1DWI2_CAEJA
MSTEQANGKTSQEKKDQVGEVTEKLANLAVDNTNEANEKRPAGNAAPHRSGPRGFRGGRGRGRGGRMGGRFAPRPPYEEQVKKIEEDLAAKKIVEKGVEGYVKWFSVRGRYGFVAREKPADEKEDFFVHQTAILKSSTNKFYLRTLDEDEKVVFDIVEGRKGLEAVNITGPDGENVRGSRFARQLFQRWLPGRGRAGRGRGGLARGESRKPRENQETNDSEKPVEDSGDGETRGKRRVRRARGKLQPKEENGSPAEGNKQREKGDGDAANAPEGEEKKERRRNNNKNRKNKKQESGEAAAPAEQAAPAQA